MNLNVEKTKQLIGIFARLTNENQDALLKNAIQMEMDQDIARSVSKAGKPTTKENIDEAKGRLLRTIKPLMDVWDDMDPNHLAALAMVMNEMSKGELTKEEYIDFVVKTRQLSVTEYIEKYIPGADIEEANKIFRTLKAKT